MSKECKFPDEACPAREKGWCVLPRTEYHDCEKPLTYDAFNMDTFEEPPEEEREE